MKKGISLSNTKKLNLTDSALVPWGKVEKKAKRGGEIGLEIENIIFKSIYSLFCTQYSLPVMHCIILQVGVNYKYFVPFV